MADALPKNGGAAEIRAAYLRVHDLFVPVPWYYWRELVLVGSAAWAAFLLSAALPSPLLSIGLGCIAVVLWYRAATMVHELTHQRREELPGFHLAWNVFTGLAVFLPSVL